MVKENIATCFGVPGLAPILATSKLVDASDIGGVAMWLKAN